MPPTATANAGAEESDDTHSDSAQDATSSVASSTSPGLPLGLSIAALALGAVGVVLGSVAVFGRKRTR